jgi:transposase
MTIESPTDGDVFLAYLDHVLCPQLLPGQIVVIYNLGAHKGDGVAERIFRTGATLLYLPPYSPDFNPIEKCRAQLKQRLRALKARSLPSLQDALTDALGILTPQNTESYNQRRMFFGAGELTPLYCDGRKPGRDHSRRTRNLVVEQRHVATRRVDHGIAAGQQVC